jgi:hypothetical protein
MNFDVIKSSVAFSKWEDKETTLTLNLDLVPKDQYQLDIGDKHVLCARRFIQSKGKDRHLIPLTVSISSRPQSFDHVKGEKPICGYAQFIPERASDFESSEASVFIVIVVEPDAFSEILRHRISRPGTADLKVLIEGLEYGPDPDGSHQIWKLDDDTDCGLVNRRRITSFHYTVETFSTRESSIQEEEDRKFHADLADSPDLKDQEIAAILQSQQKADPVADLLRQCRAILVAILGLGVLALLMLNR